MDRISTGIRQLDDILDGGLPRHSIAMIVGHPGSGKTILAQHMAFANASKKRPVLYLTTLSEPLPKLVAFLQELAFADVDRIGSEIIYESMADMLGKEPAERLVDHLRHLIQAHSPGLIIIDSFKAIMEVEPDPKIWRHIVFELGGLLAAYSATALWVGEYEEANTARLPEFAVADAIIRLERTLSGSRDDRFLRVIKLRGSGFLDGQHAFTISGDGLTVYPRLVGLRKSERYEASTERLRTGIDGLDPMVESGWLRGSSTLVAGPAGAGKTLLGLHFLRQGVEEGEAGLLVNFQESPSQMSRTIRSFGWDAPALLGPGRLEIFHTSPVELQIDTIVQEMFLRIEAHGARRVVIDALGDLNTAAGDSRRFSNYMYALTQEFAARQVTAMLIIETTIDEPYRPTGVGGEVSFLSDNIVQLSMDLEEDLVRCIRVLKSRGSAHDGRRHSMRIGRNGIRVE